MGICSGLFYVPNDPERQTLHRRIMPTGEQMAEQQERWRGLAEYLMADLKGVSGCNVRTWLQGSYKFGTQLRPMGHVREFDIDLGVYFEWQEGWSVWDNVGTPHAPDDIRNFTFDSLEAYDEEDVIEVVNPPKPRCMRVRFEGGFHIDVPVYHLEIEADERRLATEGNRWEDSDPKQIYLWFRDQFDDQRRALARRIVQYMKAWAALCLDGDRRPSSILLTILVAEEVSSASGDNLAYDDDALHTVLKAIIARLDRDPVVLNPVDHRENLMERMSEAGLAGFVDELRGFEALAEQALQEDDVIVAADHWSKVFSYFFPLPDPDELTKSMTENARTLTTTMTPEIRVVAIPRQNKQRRFTGVNGIKSVPQDCDITFTITNRDNFPFAADVRWMVRNEGSEAAYANDLGHYGGSGWKAQEHTSYVGKHYMDCVVRQYEDGPIIGYRRVPVSITGTKMPRRNPLRRPGYVHDRWGRK